MSKASDYAALSIKKKNSKPPPFTVKRDGEKYAVVEVTDDGGVQYANQWHLHKLSHVEALELAVWLRDTFGETNVSADPVHPRMGH